MGPCRRLAPSAQQDPASSHWRIRVMVLRNSICKGTSMAKLRFGYFIAPFHRAGTNPTLALQRDLEFIEHLDAIGYDEVWLGEHHSAGSEIISSPEIFIGAASQRAKRIRSVPGSLRSRTTTRYGSPTG